MQNFLLLEANSGQVSDCAKRKKKVFGAKNFMKNKKKPNKNPNDANHVPGSREIQLSG